MSSKTQAAQNSPRWNDVGFWVSLFLSISLVISMGTLRHTMKLKYDDFELDLPSLTMIFLEPITPYVLGLLPAIVLFKEYLDIGEWKTRVDTVASLLCLLLWLVAGIAMALPFIIIIDSLDG